MDKQPKIFTVMAWTRNENGTFKLSMHHVAGFDSKDAEARIVSENATYLSGQLYITTDRYIDYNGDIASSLFVTRWRDDGDVSRQVMRNWVYRMLRDDEQDGEIYPAPYRRFHVKKIEKNWLDR